MAQKFHNRIVLKNRRRQLREDATKAERLFWSRLRRKQLGYIFRRQHSIGSYIIDFYCPSLRLAVELDGPIHSEGDRPQRDIARQRYLESYGIVVKRYYNDKILFDLDGAIINLKFVCDNLSTSPCPSLSKEGGRPR